MAAPFILDDAEKRQQVLNVLAVGGSLNDAARLLKVDRHTFWRYRQRNPEFDLDVQHADTVGKLKHLKNINDCASGTALDTADWKASAYFLACKYPSEWSQKNKVEVSHRGEVDVNVSGEIDLSGFSDDELARFAQAVAGATGGIEGAG